MQKYNVLIIGAGNIGAFFDTPNSEFVLSHAHAVYNSEQFNLIGFYDINKDKAKEAAKIWNTNVFNDMDTAISSADIVCCTVPDEYHYSILKELLRYENIRLVFSEKPITKNTEEAKEIVDLYYKKGIPLMINYSRRFFFEYKNLKEIIHKGGNLLSGVAYYGKGIKHNGSHMVDIIQFLFGDICNYRKINELYDYFEDDPSVEAILTTSFGDILLKPIDCRRVTVFEMELLFENIRIRLLDSGYLIEVYEVKDSLIHSGYKNYLIQGKIKINCNNALKNAYENLYNVLIDKDILLSDAENAKNVLEICEKLKD